MNLYNRIGTYLFIIGAVLSVLDGAFLVSENVRGLVYIILIFTGIFAGLLNVSEDEEHHFLVSAGAFLIAIVAFHQLFAGDAVLSSITHFFQNAAAFVGSMAVAVALKKIIEFSSDNALVTPLEDMKTRTKLIDDWYLSPRLRAWHFIVFLAVAATFFILLLNMPFYQFPDEFYGAIGILEWAIIVVFLIDLIVLYRRENSLGGLVRHCWVDIIAAIPLPGIFGAFKIVRVARLARIARGTYSLKFFSEESGMNTYLRKSARRTDTIEIPEHPMMAQKKASKPGKGKK